MEKEVFRAGTWTDSSGRTRTFSEKDLDKIAGSFNEKTGRNIQGRNVPLFVGHPSGEAPAYGWVEKVWREGKSLFAKFKDIPNKAKKALEDSKAFKDVSISLDGIKSHILQHVGLTNMPAVAGLAGFEFNLNQLPEGAVEYTTDKNITETEANGILSWLKGKFNKEQEDLTKEKKMSEENKYEQELNSLKSSFADVEKKVLTLETENKDVKAKYEAEQKAHADLKKSIDDEKVAAQDAEENAFVDEIIKGKKLRPADKELTLEVLKSLRNSQDVEFTSPDGKKEKRNAYSDYKGRLKDAAELSEFEDMGEGKPKKDALEDAVEKHMKENQITDYNQATYEVLTLHPDLNQE